MRMVSSATPIITFRYYPYKRKKLTFWVSFFKIYRELNDYSATTSNEKVPFTFL